MHAKNDTTFPEGLKVDALQNWHLLKAHENSSHTTISFKRKLATCDDLHDVLINVMLYNSCQLLSYGNQSIDLNEYVYINAERYFNSSLGI